MILPLEFLEPLVEFVRQRYGQKVSLRENKPEYFRFVSSSGYFFQVAKDTETTMLLVCNDATEKEQFLNNFYGFVKAKYEFSQLTGTEPAEEVPAGDESPGAGWVGD